ncbi:T9SS type A sorting domain-containing protein [Hymenobacter metallicola]|uniref:T9SS type A sorting domain-containing protein n=1 Tax=Hymenobacter metallicola TaxID=2563114 RepID=A0A4Z0QJ68_9BACT|nr:T9SS type A sorting domain-containing protein [Hymenobacter metallicola]TGE29323.1 T9SS type A sorting domain-containing protein [Hymenobacter metallicola]
MKYPLLTSLAGVLLAGVLGTAQAQTGPITITQATFTASPASVDQYRPMHAAAHPDFVLPQPGAGRDWDYSKLTADSLTLEQLYQAPPATSPLYVAPTRSYPLPTTAPQDVAFPTHGLWHSFTGRRYEALTASGLVRSGYSVQEQQWPIRQTNNVPGDFLRLPAQTIAQGDVFAPTLPLTVSSARRHYPYDAIFLEATVQELGLQAARVRLVHHVTLTEEVVGYGTLHLPKPAGGQAAVPALMVRTHIQEIDSAYVNGRLAPPLVLQALHMEQGQRQHIYQTAFYRQNSSQPALLLYHTDASFSTLRNWFSIWFSGEENLSTVTGVRPAQVVVGSLKAYPNPAASGQLTLELPGERQALQLVVRDLQGRSVATAVALPGQPTPVLRGLRAGLYVVEATTQAGTRHSTRVAVE